jgi:hypothetical protein
LGEVAVETFSDTRSAFVARVTPASRRLSTRQVTSWLSLPQIPRPASPVSQPHAFTLFPRASG